MYKLSFFVPKTDLETVKDALFAAGAGRIGRYEHCCWQIEGQGQFRPLMGSDPAIGDVGTLERVAEFKVEMVCDDPHIDASIAALRCAHPYEEPAFDVIKLIDF